MHITLANLSTGILRYSVFTDMLARRLGVLRVGRLAEAGVFLAWHMLVSCADILRRYSSMDDENASELSR